MKVLYTYNIANIIVMPELFEFFKHYQCQIASLSGYKYPTKNGLEVEY